MAPMSLAASVAPMRHPLSRQARVLLLGLLALGVFVGGFVFQNSRPTIALDRGRGMYVAEGGATPFRWTSSQADFALAPHSGPTQVALTLSIADWPRQAQLPVRIASDAGVLATVAIPAQPRRVLALLPPARPRCGCTPRSRARLGAIGAGWAWRCLRLRRRRVACRCMTIIQALVLAIASVLLVAGMVWAIAHGLAWWLG